jgi:large subunit ribosomal protein L31
MKNDIHPKLHQTTITCTCGAVYQTTSTSQNIRVGICASCHPFFTGEQRLIDTAGRIDKFSQRYGTGSTRRGKLKLSATTTASAS